VHFSQGCRQANCKLQEARELKRSPDSLTNWISTGVRQHEDRAALVPGKCLRPRRPLGIKLGCERALMLEPGKTRQCWPFRDRRQDQNRRIAHPFAPKESKFAVLAQYPELVSG